MKEFDNKGLLLAGFQAKIFEKSLELNCSSLIFLRRYKRSQYVLFFIDQNKPELLDFSPDTVFYELEKQFGVFDYGKNKYPASVMFWMGYIYRYISYTRDVSTRFVFDLITPEELQKLYYVYHTQSEEWIISNILELKGKDESIFDKNVRLKEKYRESIFAS